MGMNDTTTTAGKITTVTINHNGFHGRKAVRVQATTAEIAAGVVSVSKAVAKRVNDKVCGCSDCRCGESIAVSHDYGETWSVRLPEPIDADVRGNYAQSV